MQSYLRLNLFVILSTFRDITLGVSEVERTHLH